MISQIASKGIRSGLTFAIHKPQYVSGEQLIQIFQDFKRNLMETNVLSIKSSLMRLITFAGSQKPLSLLISWYSQAIKQIPHLLKKFDVPLIASHKSPHTVPFNSKADEIFSSLQAPVSKGR